MITTITQDRNYLRQLEDKILILMASAAGVPASAPPDYRELALVLAERLTISMDLEEAEHRCTCTCTCFD